MQRSIPLLVLIALVGGCTEKSPAAKPTPAATPASEQSQADGPKLDPLTAEDRRIEGKPIDHMLFEKFLPDSIAGYTAKGPTEGRLLKIPNGGELATRKRTYEQGSSELVLEYIDARHSPNVRHIVKQAAKVAVESAQTVRKPVDIGDHKGIAQWHASNHIARVGILVGDRFIVNVNVSPADSPEPAMKVAPSLPLDEVARLAAQQEAAAPQATAAEGSAAAPPPATPEATPKATVEKAKPAGETPKAETDAPAAPATAQ